LELHLNVASLSDSRQLNSWSGLTMSNRAVAVLIVDDDPGDIQLTSEYLKPLGAMQFMAVSKASKALALLGNQEIDLMLVDWCLPGMNGLDLIRRARKKSSDLPIILITGMHRDDTAQLALEAGATGYLAKEHLPTRLAATVEEHLNDAYNRPR